MSRDRIEPMPRVAWQRTDWRPRARRFGLWVYSHLSPRLGVWIYRRTT